MRKQKKGSRKPSLFSTIPVEVLLHIFAMFSSEVPDNGLLPYPVWLPITHVCRYWRMAALGHAQLWTSVTLVCH